MLGGESQSRVRKKAILWLTRGILARLFLCSRVSGPWATHLMGPRRHLLPDVGRSVRKRRMGCH